MKKSKKHRPPKPKGRRKQKQMPKTRARPVSVSTGESASPFGGIDFTAGAESAADLVPKAREKLRVGQPREALTLLRRALANDPNDADALNLSGIAAFQTGQVEQALDMLQTAAAFEPLNAEVKTNLANVLAALGRHEEAAETYRDAMSAGPAFAEAPFNLGILMEATGEAGEALIAYNRTLDIDPKHAGAHQGRGNALKALKRLNEAKAAYANALKHNPSLPEALTNLAAVLQELGDFEGAEARCREALKLAPGMIEAQYNLAIALQEQNRYEEAIALYRDVLEAAPGHAAAALNIAYGLQQLEDLDAAAQALEKTIAIDPAFAKAHVNLADIRLQQGNPAAALQVCRTFLEANPGSTDLLAFETIALWDAGETEQARALTDLERFVKPVTIEVPDSYESLEDFNTALSEHVLAHPTLTFAPQSHATREGRHSGELLDDRKGPIAGLEQVILKAADAYRRDMGQDPDHPFLANPPKDWTLSVWGVVMQAAGHQIPHIHPAAWLSGVYYPRVPDIVSSEDQSKAGWIEFGRPPGHFHNRSEPETRSVKPEPGLMVLFPSYFYHHTVPFEAEGTRISIAFDLMPVRSP